MSPAIEAKHELDLGPELPEDILKIAIEQGEDPDKICDLIQQLRDMIFEKGEVNPHRTDDAYLMKFLRSRFWKIDHAHNLLVRYYRFRDQNQNLHEKVHPQDLQYLGHEDIVTVTPYRDQIGRRIMIYRFGKWNTSTTPVDEIFKATLILLELGSMEPIAQVQGGVGIFDLEGLTLSHIMNLTPSVAQKMIALMVTAMPIRTTAIHIVNQNWLFNAGFQIFKPFLNARMREKIFIHGSDMSSLHKHIDPDHLPERYGGVHPDYPCTLWFENLSKDERVIKELEQLGYRIEPRENSGSSSN